MLNITLSALHGTRHQHWEAFYRVGELPLPTWAHQISFVYITLLGLCGFCGNGLLFITFIRSRVLNSPSNVLVINLAVADLGVSAAELICMSPSTAAGYWLFGENGCSLYAFLVGFLGFVSIGTMTAIAIDRYISIAKWNAKWTLTYPRVTACTLLIWAYAFVLASPPLFGWSAYILESAQTSCTFDFLSRTSDVISFTVYILLVGFVVPLGIIITCYIAIVNHLVNHRRLMRQSSLIGVMTLSPKVDQPLIGSPCVQTTVGSLNREGKRSSPSSTVDQSSALCKRSRATNEAESYYVHVKATVTCVFVVTLFVVAWTPYAIVSIIGIMGDQQLLTPIVTFLPVLFAKSSCIYNPIIYGLTNRKFRRSLKSAFKWHGTHRDLGFLTNSLRRPCPTHIATHRITVLTTKQPCAPESPLGERSSCLSERDYDVEKKVAYRALAKRYHRNRYESVNHSCTF